MGELDDVTIVRTDDGRELRTWEVRHGERVIADASEAAPSRRALGGNLVRASARLSATLIFGSQQVVITRDAISREVEGSMVGAPPYEWTNLRALRRGAGEVTAMAHDGRPLARIPDPGRGVRAALRSQVRGEARRVEHGESGRWANVTTRGLMAHANTMRGDQMARLKAQSAMRHPTARRQHWRVQTVDAQGRPPVVLWGLVIFLDLLDCTQHAPAMGNMPGEGFLG